MPCRDRPYWQLPPGVPRGVWEYAQAEQVAQGYDAALADSPLFAADQAVLARYFGQPGLVVDLGCGTGRALLPLAQRGFRCLGVDLSRPMLAVVGQKAQATGCTIGRLQANLVELDCLGDAVADYALCLFSTLGMIRPAESRQRVLEHAQRILKPGGILVLHVHNVWHRLFDAAGRRWLLENLWQAWTQKDVELGDRFFDDLGVAKMFVHTFRRRELLGVLRAAHLPLKELLPLALPGQRPLRWPWLLGGLRAVGWIAVCQKPRQGGPGG